MPLSRAAQVNRDKDAGQNREESECEGAWRRVGRPRVWAVDDESLAGHPGDQAAQTEQRDIAHSGLGVGLAAPATVARAVADSDLS